MTDFAAPQALDLGRVVQDIFKVIGRNLATFVILTVIMVGVPDVIIGLLRVNMLRSGQIFDWRSSVVGLFGGLFALILQAAIIYGTVNDMNGRKVSVGDALQVGLRSFLPLFGIAIIFSVSFVFGMILLVVPGLMIACAWCVAVPAFVVERTGVFASFERSADLTRGNRWRIFGLLVVYAVIVIVVEAVLGVFGAASRLVAGGGYSLMQAVVVTPLIAVVNALIGAAGAAVIYVELRQLRDGVGPQALAAIFD